MAAKLSPQGGDLRASSEHTNASSVIATNDERCQLCRNGEPGDNRWSWCDRCLAAFFVQVRRRREAALRLAPLEDGRHDPIDKAVVA